MGGKAFRSALPVPLSAHMPLAWDLFPWNRCFLPKPLDVICNGEEFSWDVKWLVGMRINLGRALHSLIEMKVALAAGRWGVEMDPDEWGVSLRVCVLGRAELWAQTQSCSGGTSAGAPSLCSQGQPPSGWATLLAPLQGFLHAVWDSDFLQELLQRRLGIWHP